MLSRPPTKRPDLVVVRRQDDTLRSGKPGQSLQRVSYCKIELESLKDSNMRSLSVSAKRVRVVILPSRLPLI
jgi:hypothetical protein